MYRLKAVLRLPLLLVLLLFGAPRADAETCSGDQCSYIASGIEPTEKVGGAPLDNLKQIVLTPKLNGVVQAPVTIPATKPQGGGTFSKTLTITTPACKVTTLAVDAVAENSEGLKSTPLSDAVSKDRTLDPTCAPSQGTFSLD